MCVERSNGHKGSDTKLIRTSWFKKYFVCWKLKSAHYFTVSIKPYFAYKIISFRYIQMTKGFILWLLLFNFFFVLINCKLEKRLFGWVGADSLIEREITRAYKELNSIQNNMDTVNCWIWVYFEKSIIFWINYIFWNRF